MKLNNSFGSATRASLNVIINLVQDFFFNNVAVNIERHKWYNFEYFYHPICLFLNYSWHRKLTISSLLYKAVKIGFKKISRCKHTRYSLTSKIDSFTASQKMKPQPTPTNKHLLQLQ